MLKLTFCCGKPVFHLSKYNCRFLAATVMFGSDKTIARSSAYDEIDTFRCWEDEISWRNRFNSEREIAALCGRLFFVCLVWDIFLSYLT